MNCIFRNAYLFLKKKSNRKYFQSIKFDKNIKILIIFFNSCRFFGGQRGAPNSMKSGSLGHYLKVWLEIKYGKSRFFDILGPKNFQNFHEILPLSLVFCVLLKYNHKNLLLLWRTLKQLVISFPTMCVTFM